MLTSFKKIILLIVSLILFPNSILFSDGSSQISSILKKFETYRYSNVYIYRTNPQTTAKLVTLLSEKKPEEPKIDSKIISDVDFHNDIEEFSRSDVKLGQLSKFDAKIRWKKDHLLYFAYLDAKSAWELTTFSSAFVVTTRDNPVNIIALITSKKDDKAVVSEALSPGGIKDVYLTTDLTTKYIAEDLVNSKSKSVVDKNKSDSARKNLIADDSRTQKNILDYLFERIIQDDIENVTAEAQGIDGNTKFLPQKYGTTYSIEEDDVQMYLRITEGQPQEYEYPYELTVGLFDVIRFRRYGKLEDSGSPSNTDDIGTSAVNDNSKVSPVQDLAGQNPAGQNSTGTISKNSDSLNQVNPVIPVATPQEQSIEAPKKVYNRDLPLYGVELKYGLPEINYPSLWSERMTLSVMWQSNKFGIVLPTNGWSSLATDVFSAQRKLTHAGLGIYGSLDFPIKLLNQGGVFNFNGSYVFGDAAVNPIATEFMFAGRNASGQSDSASYRSLDLSYLPRFHAQAHYSFAVDIDRTAFFRFKLGATMYVIQRFAELEQQNGNDENGRPVYEKKNRQIDQYSYDDLSTLNRFDQLKIAAMNGLQGSEVIAGLSGRIEFMNRSRTVPWGASMQFFDGCISGDVWAQVPVTNQFNIRLQAQYFQSALRDPKPWELETVVIPSMQFMYNF